jgi:hypothetical protein
MSLKSPEETKMATTEAKNTRRIRYYDGQLLAARDLQEDLDYQSRMRGLHVRALHNTWGIALGLGMQLSNGDHLLAAPGLAYDCHGQELLSTDTFQLPVPPDLPAAGLILVITKDQLADTSTLPTGSICPGSAFDPTLERPTFLWRQPDQVRLGDEIPLVRVYAGSPEIHLDLSVRRYVRPLLRPHIGWGQLEIPLSQLMQDQDYSWRVGTGESQVILGFQVEVDTAAAGFTQTPFYFASSQLILPDPLGAISIFFESVAESGLDRFTLQLLYVPTRTSLLETINTRMVESVRAKQPGRLEIFWTGIEPVVGQNPPVNLWQVFTRGGVILRELLSRQLTVLR